MKLYDAGFFVLLLIVAAFSVSKTDVGAEIINKAKPHLDKVVIGKLYISPFEQ